MTRKPGPGRPKLEEPRSVRVAVRMSERERDMLQHAAGTLDLSTFIRQLALNALRGVK